ncbi:unnamed protein product [Adineta steineri]|uniref:Uncharacterized protein n=1 Tax=Adineta steineri TaxID=433720 RepID=A0A820K9N5_9BILA|nr:unnamed protein product [Adineta steineri]
MSSLLLNNTKDNLHSTLQRTIDQLRADKASVDRKLQDAEVQLKAIDDNNRQVKSSIVRKSLTTSNHNQNEDDDDDDENLTTEESVNKHQNGYHDDDEIDRLSDTDSDVVEMEQTLKQLRRTQLEYIHLHKPNKGKEKCVL